MSERLKGLESNEAGWFAKVAFWMTKRRLGRVIDPLKVLAHNPASLKAHAKMEMGQQAARTVPLRIKTLAQIKAATLIGCPF